MTRLALAGAGLLGAALAFVAQPESDRTRHARRLDELLVFVPSPEGVRAASTGFEEVAADLLWVRAVLLFGEQYDNPDPPAGWAEWLAGMLDTVTTLDPRWRTPYLYGGGMLRSMGEIEASSRLYERCTEEIPADAWCPFSRGMNDLLYGDDPLAAAEWLKLAAARPKAPKWYGAAAAAFKSRAGQRQAGLLYLEEQINETTDPAVKASLELQRGRLLHDRIVEKWAEACRAEQAGGRALRTPAELSRLGFELPENPRQDPWVVGRDGVVRSEGAERERVRRARGDEWKLIRR